MANILKSFFSQCARPEGALGRVMLIYPDGNPPEEANVCHDYRIEEVTILNNL